MGTILGVVVGYALGTRAGEDGWAELREAWKVIATSDEVRDLVGGGLLIARDLLGRGSVVLADLLGAGPPDRSLRPVA
ncbi:MAG: hypothetical protein ACRDYY_10165 [Acidimicrobiales bacterium]